MRTVYEAANLIDGHLMLHRLQAAGIEAQVLGGYLSGGIGELPVAGLIRVVVADQDEEAALAVAAQLQEERDSGQLDASDADWDASAKPA